jgi:hypothetical protein
MANTNEITKSLNPIRELEGKNNYQEITLIAKDGKTKTRIILFIPNVEIREQIICRQYLSRYVQLFLEETIGVKYVSRDNPWDFEIELSNSEKLIIEITSIADEVDLFRTFKYQERITEKSNYEYIEFHELIKLNNLFPDPQIDKLIHALKEDGTSKDKLVLNPNYGKKFMFQSSISEDLESFDKILRTAIEKKVKKKHSRKEDVTLILDNRTVTYELEDILEYLENLSDYFENLPFKEVWLYTGYYSDLDGSNAEYSLAPLKITEMKFKKLKNKLK